VTTDEAGAVIVDANGRTNVPNIYAVGDVSNGFHLTPAAIREGHAFADSVFGDPAWRIDYANIPTAVFSTPEVGTVGLTEAEARDQFAAIDVFKTRFALSGARSADNHGLLKIVNCRDTGRIVGVHAFCDEAAEFVQLIAIAMRKGAALDDVALEMATHPMFGDAFVHLLRPATRYVGPIASVPTP
jgi:glutathione reductase (NADPH)